MADDEEVVDLWRLQKRLGQEYAFVNQQKRGLQKEYASIVSTGDALFQSLWINGQQWKNLQRLKGGAKFASECVYTSNLLDSIPFVDGYARIGFKEVKYGSLLRELRDNTDLFKSILIFADQLNLDTSAFVRAMLISLYGSCLFPRDERSVLVIAKSIIEYHLVFSQMPHVIFKAQRNSFWNILDVLMESFSARAFLVSVCKDVVLDILLDGSMFWMLEEQELLSVMMPSEIRQRFGDPGNPETTKRIKNYMTQSWEKLSQMISTILNKIKESLDCLPDIFLWIVAYFYRFSLKRGLSDAQAKIMVMRFLFEQVITPSLLQPQPLLIDTEVRASQVAMFNLKKIALILQTLISIEAGEDLKTLSAEARTFYKNLDRCPLNEIVDSLLEKIPKDDELITMSDVENMPGLARTSVLITKNDLDALVIFLNKLQCQEIALVDKENLASVLTHVQAIDSDVTIKMANLKVAEENNYLQNELQEILQAFNKPFDENEEVLVISLGVSTVDCPGLLPEEKVLGLPTPGPKRKTLSEPKTDNVDELFNNSLQWESDSPESSADEKPPEVKSENDEQDEGVVIGFDDSFTDFPLQGTPQQFATQKKPFHGFDPLSTIANPNDPFLTVVSSPSENILPTFTPSSIVSPAFAPSPLSPVDPFHSHTASESSTVGLLVDVGECTSDFRSSSGSSQSGKRFSSSASSSSDSGRIPTHTNKEKPLEKKHSFKANLQNVLKNPLQPQKNKRTPKDTMKSKKKNSKNSKKKKDAIIHATDVATIIAAGAEKEQTAKVICDAIIDKYSDIKLVRLNISLPDKPMKRNSDTLTHNASWQRDEEEFRTDAKNKLRLVLSNNSTPNFPLVPNSSFKSSESRGNPGAVLLTHLKRDLADAMATQDSTMKARLRETLNTLEKLPSSRYPQLLKELENEYCQRKAYVSYLVRSHQGLMGTREYLEKMLERVKRDREICRRYLMTQCVSMYLGDYKDKLDLFIRKFKQLSMSDEKSEEMKNFLQDLKEDFQKDPLWLGSNEEQRCEANNAIERYVIARVYLHAVYAFGETDKCRDDVFHTSVELLCKSIGEDFSSLDIKEEYQLEAPWFPAQQELFTLSAYKTPTDKLKCIERCYTTVMNLLAMSSGSSAIGADAFTPVFIYVVMHANPKGLLTTVDFINSYLIEPLTGEQYYCWMQFCSAIQFIKILLEENNSNPV